MLDGTSGLFFFLLAFRLLDLGTLDRRELATGRSRSCYVSGCLSDRFRGRFFNRCWLGFFFSLLLGLFFGLAVIFGALFFVDGSLLGGCIVTLARIFGELQTSFLGFALETSDTFLRSFGSRRRLLGRSLLGHRRGCRSRFGNRFRHRCRRRRRRRFARLDELTAALHLDRNLIGAAVAEGLLDLARLSTLEGQRFTGRFLFVVAHSCSFLFFVSFKSSSARGIVRPLSVGISCPR